MRDLEQFRPVNQFELNIIDSSLSELNTKLSDFLNNNSNNIFIGFVSQKKFPSIFLVSKNLQNSVKYLKQRGMIDNLGLYLGFIKKSSFYLSLEGADYFYLKKYITNNRLLVVNKKGEKSVLYGNHITKEMVKTFPDGFQKGNLCLVINGLNELLAISILNINFSEITNVNPKQIVAQNLIDKGIYLREKQ